MHAPVYSLKVKNIYSDSKICLPRIDSFHGYAHLEITIVSLNINR